MGQGSGIREVAWIDIAGGGQVVVDGNHAYVGHMDPPHGTSVLDVSDPANPRVVASIDIPPGLHSHKVRVANDLMLANRERIAAATKPADDFVGLRIFDVSRPANPRDICHWACAGMGVHRFTFDGRYAYISAELEGYVGTIVMILDLADPTRPQEVGRWWMEGQWIAGGETPELEGPKPSLPPSDPPRRSAVCQLLVRRRRHPRHQRHDQAAAWSPPSIGARRSAGPRTVWCRSIVPIAGHRWMLVADEHVQPLDPDLSPELPAMVWMVNITDETRPIPVSCFQLPELVGVETPLMTACHQPVETIVGNEVPAAWFANGLRVIDISNPLSMKQAAWWMPDVPPGAQRVCSNDVYVDHRGLIYLIDRNRGLSILERTWDLPRNNSVKFSANGVPCVWSAEAEHSRLSLVPAAKSWMVRLRGP